MPQGKLGMSIDGIWVTGNWKDTGASPWEDYQDKVGLAAMPTNEGQDPGTVTMSGGWALSIPENADNTDTAATAQRHSNAWNADYAEFVAMVNNPCLARR